MSYTKKASKTNRNQPANFDETLAAAIDMPVGISQPPRLTLRQLRLALSVVWVAAALIAGVGIGRMISDARNAAIITEPPVPVATANISTTKVDAGAIGRAQAISTLSLRVVPSEAIMQAQAGNVFAVMSAANLQQVNTFNALQPGYDSFVHSQGNIGTTPVR